MTAIYGCSTRTCDVANTPTIEADNASASADGLYRQRAAASVAVGAHGRWGRRNQTGRMTHCAVQQLISTGNTQSDRKNNSGAQCRRRPAFAIRHDYQL